MRPQAVCAARGEHDDSARVMALEAENAKLRSELQETQETVEVFKRIIVEGNPAR